VEPGAGAAGRPDGDAWDNPAGRDLAAVDAFDPGGEPVTSHSAPVAADGALPVTVAGWRARFPQLTALSPEFAAALAPGMDPAATLAPSERSALLPRLARTIFTLTRVDLADVPRVGFAVLDAVETYADRLPPVPLTDWPVWATLCAPPADPTPVPETPAPPDQGAAVPGVPAASDARPGGAENPGPPRRRLTPGRDSGRGRLYLKTLPSPQLLVESFGLKRPGDPFARRQKDRHWNALVVALVGILDGWDGAAARRHAVVGMGQPPEAADALRDLELVSGLSALDDRPGEFWLRFAKTDTAYLARLVGWKSPWYPDTEPTEWTRSYLEEVVRHDGWSLPLPDLDRLPTPADWHELSRQILLGLHPRGTSD